MRTTLGSGFSTHTKPAPNSPGPWKKGVGSGCHTLANSVIRQPVWDLPAGASCPFLCGSPGGLATAQFVKCAFKSFVSPLSLSVHIDGALPCARCWGQVVNGAEILIGEVDTEQVMVPEFCEG